MRTKKSRNGTKKKIKKGRGKVRFSDSTEKNDNHGKVLQKTKTKRNVSSLYTTGRTSKNMAATIRAFNSARMINSSSPLMDELTEDVKTLFQSNLGKKRISDIINKKELNLKDMQMLNNFAKRAMRKPVPSSYVSNALRGLRRKLVN
jgi:hypothetical protein